MGTLPVEGLAQRGTSDSSLKKEPLHCRPALFAGSGVAMPKARIATAPVVAAALSILFAALVADHRGGDRRVPAAGGDRSGGIAAGPDGALWYIEEGTDRIGRITTAGTVTAGFAIPTTPSPVPFGDLAFVAAADQITLGPDGALWFSGRARTRSAASRSGASGDVTGYTSYPTGSSGTRPEGIDVGPDGAL